MNLKERKENAKTLRRLGEYKKALLLYRELWNETQDKYDGTGLLHCLRKLELFDEALLLAEKLTEKSNNFKWCQQEICWTYINGVLLKYRDIEPLETIINTANKILCFSTDDIITKKVVFIILKKAKQSNRWDIVSDWLGKLAPDKLSETPIKNELGRELWSEKALWYNYFLNCLLIKKEFNKVIDTVDQILDSFPRHKKFFLRLKALTLFESGNLTESEKIYNKLCTGNKIDWWLLYEYAKVVMALNKTENALQLMCQAGSNCPKLELIVNMLVDIGLLYKDFKKYEEARSHLILSKLVRIKNGWKIPNTTIIEINELNQLLGNNDERTNFNDIYKDCRTKWNDICQYNQKSTGLNKRKDCVGYVNLGLENKSYCFIYVGSESFFCFKKDLPTNLNNRDMVIFDLIDSYDKTKNKESLRAINIRIIK